MSRHIARVQQPQALLIKYRVANPKLFGSVDRGTAHSDSDILVEMDPEVGNLLICAAGLMVETRARFGRDDIDVFPVQLLKRPISATCGHVDRGFNPHTMKRIPFAGRSSTFCPNCQRQR